VKAEASVLPRAALSTSDAVSSGTQCVDDTVGTEAGVTSAELLAANQPAADQPRTAATAPDIRTDDESCDSAAAGDSEWLSYACSSSLSAATDVVVDAEGNVVSSEPSPTLHARAADTAVDCATALCSSSSSAATGTAAGNVASSASDSAVITYGDAEFVSATNAASSCQTANALPAAAPAAAAANDTTLRLSFGTILAESFVTGAQSAATVVSTQASVGSMSAAGETSATSDLVRSSASGVLLSSFFTACALNQ